jgi:hypothetical protein
VPCEFYWDEAVAYYTPGGKEVRPIPGREKEYRAALGRFRKEFPKLRFADGADAATGGADPSRKGTRK